MRTARVSSDFGDGCGTLSMMALLLVIFCGLPVGAQTIMEINPSQSTLWSSDPNGASGGRVNHVGVAQLNKNIMFAASEWGGIYKSIDRGKTWTRMNGHHPTVTWDVKVSPLDSNRVIATSFYDGRVNSLAGISVSTDGGTTWTHPPSAIPPVGLCTTPNQRSEPSAYGISFDPAHPQNVYVGTNCGLAISNNGGNTWHYVDPTPADKAADVWSVVVHHGGIIDTCGHDGHQRSTNGGAGWTSASTGGTPLPSGMCSITASPDESYVLFAEVGTIIFESDNGGGSWTSGAYPNPQNPPFNRIEFLKTNSRGANKYDLWFGDASLYRRSCNTPSPPASGGNSRCQDSSGWTVGFTSSNGAHDDMGEIAFDPSPGKLDACPIIMSSDGGVFLNILTASPDCQTPRWAQPNVTPHGLWVFGMNGAHAASGVRQSLYFGNQDNGSFASTDAQTISPTWANIDCCDIFDVVADTNQVLYPVCCFCLDPTDATPCVPVSKLYLRNVGMIGGGDINFYPNGKLLNWTRDLLDRFGHNEYVVLTDAGVFITTDITANPISWIQLGAASNPPNVCGVHAAVSGSTPSFFVQAGRCIGSLPDQIWRYDGTDTSGTWTQVNPPSGFGFGVFTVDKKNPDRMFASVLADNQVQMVLSANGGMSWSNLSALDRAMTAGGTYQYKNTLGPTDFTGFDSYAQPTLVAFSPLDPKTLVAAGADSGVFLSTDAGGTWKTVTDNSGTASNPHVPRARFASFDQQDGTYNTFIGSQGRGVWKLQTCSAGLTLCSGACVNTSTDAHNCNTHGN